MASLAVLGDIHGNVAALEAALADIKKHKPDRIVVTGDLVINGPRPAEAVDRLRELDADGAVIVQGNTDIAVADFDYAAAFPWMEDVPVIRIAPLPNGHTSSCPTTSSTGCAACPSERRLWSRTTAGPGLPRSPGSQTNGLPADLDPSVTVERVTRTDARVIVLRPHPRRRHARAWPQAHRQPRLVRLRLRRRSARLGAADGPCSPARRR